MFMLCGGEAALRFAVAQHLLPRSSLPLLVLLLLLLLLAAAAAEWNVQRHYFYDCSGIQNVCARSLVAAL